MKNDIKITKARNINRFLPMQEKEVWNLINDELINGLTARQLSLVAAAINQSYHNGRAACGAEELDEYSGKNCGAVWVNNLEKIIEWKKDGDKASAWVSVG